MRAGKLRHLITIEKPTITKSMGQDLETWDFFKTTWAGIEPVKVNQTQSNKVTHSEMTHTIVIRYIPGITKEKRIIFFERVFEILD